MAFLSVSRPHLKLLASKGNAAAQRILRLKENPEQTLSVLQISITLVGSLSAAVGGISALQNLKPWLENYLQLNSTLSVVLALILIVIPLTYFTIVVGELLPKALALKFPLRLVLAGGVFIRILDQIFAPIVFILDFSSRFLLKLIAKKIPAESLNQMNISVDLEPLSESNKQYVLNLIKIDKCTVKDIIVPWDDVIKLDIADHYTVVLQTIKETRKTRLPVIENEKIVGILHTKEFVSEGEVSRLDWTELIRPVLHLQQKEQILSALKKLQTNRSHLAIVSNSEETLGIVTIEDIFEEVVGDIFDENDSPRTLLSTNSIIRTMNIGEIKK